MSRRNRNNKIGWIIFGIILFSAFSGVGEVLLGLGVFLVIVAVVIGIIMKALKSNGGYTQMKDTRPSANPYSQTLNTANKNVNVNTGNANQPAGNNVRVQTGNANPQVQYNGQQPQAQPQSVPAQVRKPVRPSTGDKDIDKMLEDKDAAIAEMHRLNNNIEDPTLSEQIEHLESVTDKIVNYVVAHPKKKKQVTKFFNYYLPTTLKLLNAYDRMDDAGISGTNIDGTKGKVEEMMGTALNAFDKQLDALFAEEALDVTTDISVMENMLKAEGLMDDELMNEAKELVKSYKE